MTTHTGTPRRSRNAASAGGAAPLQNRPRDYLPCGTPRNHAEEIANARYAGNSPESDAPCSRDPFPYMVQDFEGGTLARVQKSSDESDEAESRWPPAAAVFVWVALVCIAVAVEFVRRAL